MGGVNFRSLTFMILIAVFVWCSSIETCIARRGKHWRQSRYAAALSKKKGGSHGHRNYHNGGSKPTPPPPQSHKATPSPKPKEEVPPSTPSPHGRYGYDQQSTVFNVLDFGAKGDGKSDDTKAFQDTWAAACKVEASTVVVPAEFVFLVGPISFSGPYCQANIVFQLDGTIIAPTDARPWGKGLLQWLEFTKLKGIAIQGKGIIDGRGSGWWQDAPYEDPYDDERKLIIPLNSTVQERPPMPVITYFSFNLPLEFYVDFTGITIQNSPQCHLKFDNCMGVVVHDITVSSPGDSPNTDGIHLQNSNDVLIHSSDLACVSASSYHSKFFYNSRLLVSFLTYNLKSHLQGGSGSVQGVLFSNIQVSEVQLPVVIDQFYCDKRKCSNETAAVALSGITYEKIRGTYTVKPVHFACSDSLPCIGVTLSAIELKPVQERYHLYDPFCWQTFGELTTPTVPPISCLQIGKPTNNRVQSDHDVC
ncbi:polygalacturonase [Gossypium australe]|uniref:Polygalacturonase n=1 Tax=Gossypium australe TaxID=47621 RepID=A0A5B6WP24_9ROSI|nr:polygalacturonase [Gossypium australe]